LGTALELIERLESAGISNSEVDWEHVLRLNYCVLMDCDRNFVDVGGNLGSHSACFIRDMGAARIAIFEPIPDMLNCLRERFDSDNRITIYPYALSNETTQATFHFKSNAPAESGLALKNIYSDGLRDNIVELTVEVRRLDDIELGFVPQFIKIDIEGGEIGMLKGAASLIQSCRPLISVEYGFVGYEAFGHTSESLPDWAQENGYTIFDLFGNPFDRSEFLECVNRYYWDYMLLPNEKIFELKQRLDIVKRVTLPVPMSK
jgi:FkbM family methyltransferase